MEPAPAQGEAPAAESHTAHNHAEGEGHDDDDDQDEEEGELELYAVGDIEIPDTILQAANEAHDLDAATARTVLEEVAMALTRASIMATVNALADTIDDD